jgi:phosphate transport system permease protein
MTSAGRDRVAAVVLALGPLSALAVGLGLGLDLAWRGAGNLGPAFLLTGPADAGRAGGIGPFLVSTGWVLLLALLFAVPVGLLAALWLSEGRGAPEVRWVRAALDVLSAIPSVIFGLFGLSLFCEALGLGWSVLAGGLTVAGMILPLFVRLAEEGLRAVPDELRLAGAALGLPRWAILLRLVLPHAAPTLGAGLLLSTGRVLAESAALMFTAGSSIRTPDSPLDPGRVLAYHVYQMAIEVPGGQPRACASALVLLAAVLASGLLARAAPALLLRRPA